MLEENLSTAKHHYISERRLVLIAEASTSVASGCIW